MKKTQIEQIHKFVQFKSKSVAHHKKLPEDKEGSSSVSKRIEPPCTCIFSSEVLPLNFPISTDDVDYLELKMNWSDATREEKNAKIWYDF